MGSVVQRSSTRRRLASCATACVALLLASCTENPATGKRQLALISEAQEIELGRQAAQQVELSMSLVENETLQAYVNRLGQQLAAKSERPELPWRFAVVDDPTPNAFALPGGFIYVTRGMLVLMDTEAELVTVLGHEIAHVTARHSVSQLSRAQLAQLGLGLGTALFPDLAQLAGLAGAGMNLVLLKYGRDAERQADELGFGYARATGYDVAEMADVFVSLDRLGNLEKRSALPSWLATHPAPAERVKAVQARLARMEKTQLESTDGRAEYLNQIDGLSYGENPRNGYFEKGRYYHPSMAFQFVVPESWQHQNLAQAVIAVAPDQNAAFQLTMAAEEGAMAALQRFAAQQGIRTDQAARTTIHGLNATATLFQAQTQQGDVMGQVAFIEYQGKVFELVGYAPAQGFGAHRETIASIIGSFAPLTDPEVLKVEPPVIDIVRLERDMSLTEFSRLHSSALPLERLVIINQVANADVVLSRGTLVKRVVGAPLAPAS